MANTATLPRKRLEPDADQATAGPGDQDLLARFIADGEEAAFARLVERHGRTVWGVCRRILRQEQDVEDAFQAVFIVLARKAALIRKGEAVRSWLYSVAYRTAMKAKTREARKRGDGRGMRGEIEARTEETPWGQAACRELQRMLDEELHGLPEKLRAPFVLCCLEGMSKPEAAQELGWNEGTLSGRLAQARKLLHARLARRGVALSAILTAGAIAQSTAAAAPPVLVHATVQGVLTPLVAETAAATLSPSAVALAEGILPSFVVAKINAGACLIAATTVLVAGASLAALQVQPVPAEVKVEETIAVSDPVAFVAPPVPFVEVIDDQVLTLGLSPDGTRLVTAGARHLQPGQIKVWDLASRTALVTIKGIPGVRSLAMSPTGETFATGDFASTLRIRDTQTGKELAAVRGHTSTVNGVAWSADGTHIVTASLDKTVKLWNAKDLKEKKVFVGHTDWVFSTAFFKHGGAVVSGGRDNTARIWDVATGKERFTLTGHASGVEAVAVSPDDKIVATASWDQTVKLWDADTGKEIGVMEGGSPWAALLGLRQAGSAMYFVAFSPDGNLLAGAGADGSVRLWDVKTRKLITTLGRHFGSAWTVAFSRDGKTLASGSTDKSAKLFDVDQRKEIATFVHGERKAVRALAYSPDGSLVAAADQGKIVVVRDAKTGVVVHLLAGHAGDVTSLAFAPDGETLATGSLDQTVKVWDLAANKEKHTLKGHTHAVAALVFTKDGKKIASAGEDDTLRWWEADTGKDLATLKANQGSLHALAIAADTGNLASGGSDGTIKVWDQAKPDEPMILKGHGAAVHALAFSAGGKLASSGQDGLVIVWDPSTGNLSFPPLVHPDGAPALVFTPGGKTLITGSMDRIFHLWDVATGQRRGALSGPQQGITAFAMHPLGKEFISGSHDATLLRWAAFSPTPPPITLEGNGEGTWFAVFSPAGDRLATGGSAGNITLWTRSLAPAPFTYPTGARTFRDAVFSPDGKSFAVGGTKDVMIFDAVNARLKRTFPIGQNVRVVVFSPDSRFLAAGTGDMGKPNQPSETRLIDVASGNTLTTLAHEGAVLRVLFSRDGKTLITSSSDKTRRLWEVPTGKPKGTLLGHKGAAKGMVLLPDDTLVTAGYDGTIRFWDIEAGKEKKSWKAGMGLASLAASPDGTLLAAAQSSADGKGPAPLKIWDVTSGKEKLKLEGHAGRILGVSFTADGLGLLAAGGELNNYGEISYWDLVTGQIRLNHKSGKQWFETPAVSNDGKLVVGPSGNGLSLWRVGLTHKERSWEGHKAFTSCALFLDDGRVLATGAADHVINLWNVRTGEPVASLKGHTDLIRTLAVAKDGKTLFSSGGDKTIRLWDLTTHKHQATLQGNDPKLSVFALAVSPDGKTLASGGGEFAKPLRGELILWDVEAGKPRQTLPDTHSVLSLAYSPDGNLLAGSTFDGSIKVWDAKNGELRRVFKMSFPRPVKFSPDGKLLVAASGKAPSKTEPGDGRIRIWDTATWKERPMLQGHEHVIFSVDVSPDAATVASAGQDGTIKLWSIPEGTGTIVPITVARRPDAPAPIGVNRLVGTGDINKPAPAEAEPPPPSRWRLWIALGIAGAVVVASGVGLWRMNKRGRSGQALPRAAAAPETAAKPSEATAALAFSCTACGKQLKARAELAGKRVKCPHCGTHVQVAVSAS